MKIITKESSGLPVDLVRGLYFVKCHSGLSCTLQIHSLNLGFMMTSVTCTFAHEIKMELPVHYIADLWVSIELEKAWGPKAEDPSLPWWKRLYSRVLGE